MFYVALWTKDCKLLSGIVASKMRLCRIIVDNESAWVLAHLKVLNGTNLERESKITKSLNSDSRHAESDTSGFGRCKNNEPSRPAESRKLAELGYGAQNNREERRTMKKM
jgi:hypothetical protein